MNKRDLGFKCTRSVISVLRMNIGDGIFLCRRRREEFLNGVKEHGDFLVKRDVAQKLRAIIG